MCTIIEHTGNIFTIRQAATNEFFFSQVSAATLFNLGGQVYKFLMSNFLRILYTGNYNNRLFFRQVIQNT